MARRPGFPWGRPPWPATVPRAAPQPRLGVDYDTSWARRYPVRLARAVVLDNISRPALRLLADPEVRGRDRIESLQGPVIFASNHASHIDTPLVLTSLPARFRHKTVVVAAADYFFDRAWKALLWSAAIAAVPVDRKRVERRSPEMVASLVEQGWNVVIYPEGGRSPDGWGQRFHGGAAYLAERCGTPVVPVHLEGTSGVLRPYRSSLRRGRVRVSFGAPLRPVGNEGPRRFSRRIEDAVATLADEVSSDWWSAAKRAGAGATPGLAGPQAADWRRRWEAAGRREAAGGRGRWPNA